MRGQVRAILPYYDRPGFVLTIAVTPRAAQFEVAVTLNGATVRAARRPTLTSSLRWALVLADRILTLFGQKPPAMSVEMAVREVLTRLAA